MQGYEEDIGTVRDLRALWGGFTERRAQVWVHALYIALLSTELPPAAVEHRVSRSFYGTPWELDTV